MGLTGGGEGPTQGTLQGIGEELGYQVETEETGFHPKEELELQMQA